VGTRRFEDVELGDEFEVAPDVSMEQVRRFGGATGMTWGRFTDHEQARKEGLPGAIVPGVMSQGLLVSAIHAWAPGCEVRDIDTVFRAPVSVDSKPSLRVVVTDLDEAARTVQLDLTIANEAHETRVMGTAIVAL
jgi:hypothetical protein